MPTPLQTRAGVPINRHPILPQPPLIPPYPLPATHSRHDRVTPGQDQEQGQWQDGGTLPPDKLCHVWHASCGHTGWLSCFWISWVAAIIRNHKSGYHHSHCPHGDLQQKLNTTKFGAIFMLPAILDSSHYQNNKNGWNDSTICDFWLWLTSKMPDNMIVDQRWSQNNPPSKTSSSFSNIYFYLI